MGDISIRGKSPILRQSFAIGGLARGLRGLRGRKGRGKDFKTHGKDVPTMAAKGGRIGLPSKRKDFQTHGKDVPTMAAKGGRIGLNKGGKPWGTGPKPGTHEFLLQQINKPRKKKAIGGAMKAGKAITKIVERLGGGEEGKPHSTKKGRIASGVRRIKRGLSARQRDKWGDLPPWRRDSKAEGGRIGLKKGGKPWGAGPKPGTHEFLQHHLHKPRKGKAIGGWTLRKPVQKLLEGIGGGSEGKPHSTRAGRISAGVRKIKRGVKEAKKFGSEKGSDWKKGKFGKKTVAAMKKHDFPAGGPHQSLEGKKAALQHATIRAGEPKKKKVDWEKGKFSKATLAAMKKHDFPGGGPHQTVAGKKAGLRHASIRAKEAEGGRIGLKKGSNKKWIQKAVDPKHKGYCTPMTKKTCTPARKALARTFKKKAKTGW